MFTKPTLAILAAALMAATAAAAAAAPAPRARPNNPQYQKGYEDGYQDAYRRAYREGFSDARGNRRFDDSTVRFLTIRLLDESVTHRLQPISRRCQDREDKSSVAIRGRAGSLTPAVFAPG